MGDIAEAMLDGVFCQVCGEFMGEGDGYPRTCEGCGGDEVEKEFQSLMRPQGGPGGGGMGKNGQGGKPRPFACGAKGCRKKFTTQAGVDDHRRDIHGPNPKHPRKS